MASTPVVTPIAAEVHHLTLKPPASALALQQAPQLVLEEAARAAQALRDVIEKKPKKVVLNGKTFLQFEDWQTLGRFYGVTAAARTSQPVSFGKVQGFECHAEALLVANDQVISGADAMCLDDEPNWNTRGVYEYQGNRRVRVGEEKVPLYQLRSMAQTRACAKALRNVLAWVVVLAGYSPTPAEEMNAEPVATQPAAAASSSTRIPTDRVQQVCTAIANAPDMAQLQRRYMSAGREAQKNNDRAALAAFVAVKDQRKRELR